MDYCITWAAQRVNLPKIESEYQNLSRKLKIIWRECYADSEEYIDFFFEKRFEPKNTIIAICRDQIVGAAYLLPINMITGEGEIPAVFGYALGVLKEYRGKGITGRIHDFIFRYCDEKHCVFIAHPANEKLADYYKSTGLIETGYIKKTYFNYAGMDKPQDLFLADIGSDEYAKLRNTFFMGEGYFKWDKAAIHYAVLENHFCGGFCKKLISGSKEYAILGRAEDNRLVIIEAAIPDSLLPELLQRLAAYFKADEVTAFLPTACAVEGTVIPWIMGYNMQALHNGYCNLLLN